VPGAPDALPIALAATHGSGQMTLPAEVSLLLDEPFLPSVVSIPTSRQRLCTAHTAHSNFRFCLDDTHVRRYPAIPATVDRANEIGIAEHLPRDAGTTSDDRVDNAAVLPQAVQQFKARHYTVPIANQVDDEVQYSRLNMNYRPTFAHFKALLIDYEVTYDVPHLNSPQHPTEDANIPTHNYTV
jgi:hypothetical protein